MNSDAIPLIKLEVEHMKHKIVSALGIRGSEVSEQVELSIDKALATYDWDGVIKQVVDKVLIDQIHAYFSYGEGNKVIRESIKECFSKGD